MGIQPIVENLQRRILPQTKPNVKLHRKTDSKVYKSIHSSTKPTKKDPRLSFVVELDVLKRREARPNRGQNCVSSGTWRKPAP